MYDYLTQALRDCGIVEIRHNTKGRWESGLFNDLPALLKSLESRMDDGALYCTLNKPSNRLITNAFGAEPLRNDDMEVIKRIPFDFDPIRPTDASSTDAEMEAAIECRNEVVTAMQTVGWPMPAMALSGNGAHAIWRCSIKSDDQWRMAANIIYSQVKSQFSSMFEARGVKFDTSIKNPGRILRLYGTVNRKGQNTVLRPHRLSSVRIPPTWQNVTVSQVQDLANRWAKSHRAEVRQAFSSRNIGGKGDYRTLDVVDWFRAKGMYEKPAGMYTHSVRCPWEDEHSTHGDHADTVIFENPGTWPGFYCHHSHCEGRNIIDVIKVMGDADAYCAAEWGGRHG